MVKMTRAMAIVFLGLGVTLAALKGQAEVPLPSLDDWVSIGHAHFAVAEGGDGNPESMAITNPPEHASAFPRAYATVVQPPGTLLEATALAKPQNISQGYGAYITLEHVDESGERISFDQSGPAMDGGRFARLLVRGAVPKGAVETRFCLVVNGTGVGDFHSPALRVLAPAPRDAAPDEVIFQVASEALPGPYMGFGYEDDGWFYNEQNARHGADDAAYALREARIRELQPDWVRMFFWYKDWNPSHDWENFHFDSDNMESHYRALEIYQSMGTAVMGCGVEWGMKAPFAEKEALARATGELLEHLIKEKGFTVLRYWTLTNEPNLSFERSGATFEDYVRIHQLLQEEFQQRGLDVQLVGSDDTNGGEAWFEACVEDERYWDSVDLFASHIYLKHDGRRLAQPFFTDRLDQLKGRKPFVVAEFGFQDERSGTFENPLMRSYDYGLWSLDFALQGLNLGVAGFAIWGLSEMYYPGRDTMPMEYGLWNFGPDWALRPIYSAWKLLSAHTQAGDQVRAVSSNHSEVLGVVVGRQLFWVNGLDEEVALQIKGANTWRTLHIHSEEHWKTPQTHNLDDAEAAHRLPPRSFGRFD